MKSNRDETEEEVNEEEDNDEEKDEDDVDELDGKDDTAENKEEDEEEMAEVGKANDDVAGMGAGDVVKLGDEEMNTPEEVENVDVPLE